MSSLVSLIATSALAASSLLAAPGPPTPPLEDLITGQTVPGGAILRGVETRAPRATAPGPGPAGPVEPPPAAAGPTFEYLTVIECTASSLDHPDQTQTCYSAARTCALPNGSIGSQARQYRRPTGTTEWTYQTTTCVSTVDPGNTGPGPGVITEADIQRAFSETPFATPTGSTQPPGGATLVNLRTYFTLTWPDQGYRPGQTRTLTLLGHTVDLHLTSPGHTYHFGDGTTAGPTPSLGGPYPTGDITHTYPHAGTVTPTATTTITADYRIDGGPWLPLPGHATQTTTFPALTVLTATNRLHANPR